MSYVLHPSRPLEDECRRIASRQLNRAIEALRGIEASWQDERAHQARRRVKKVRALLRLVAPVFKGSARHADRRLRAVNHLLAPVCEASALLLTLERVERLSLGELAPRTMDTVRGVALARLSDAHARVDVSGILAVAVKRLRRERERARRWRLHPGQFDAITSRPERSARRARRAMRLAAAHPTIDNYHRWRRRAKEHWLHVRLLARCGGGRPRADAHALDVLEGYLGEQHDCAVLEAVVRTDATLDRSDAVATHALLRRYRLERRRDALRLGTMIYGEPAPRAQRVFAPRFGFGLGLM